MLTLENIAYFPTGTLNVMIGLPEPMEPASLNVANASLTAWLGWIGQKKARQAKPIAILELKGRDVPWLLVMFNLPVILMTSGMRALRFATLEGHGRRLLARALLGERAIDRCNRGDPNDGRETLLGQGRTGTWPQANTI